MVCAFISYAAGDPDWPADVVRRLGADLESLGVEVLLDQFHEARVRPPRDLSLGEWRSWMREGLLRADYVVCLASARYRQASDRDLADKSGYGVAYESLAIIDQLYREKGWNKGRVLTARPNGAARDDLVPVDLNHSDIVHYEWPRKRVRVLEHASNRLRIEFAACGVALPAEDLSDPILAEAKPAGGADQLAGAVEAPGPGVEPPTPVAAEDAGASTPLGVALEAQAGLASTKLADASQLFRAICVNRDGDVLTIAPPAAREVPSAFIDWLSNASLDHAREVMWAVRTALEDHPGLCADGAAQQAAIAVYMLCALRWVENTPTQKGDRAIAVPNLRHNVLAVLSAAFFGGRIQFTLQASSPRPMHVYDVRAPVGESASTNLLRAIYSELLADDMSALEVARRDDDDASLVEEMLQRIQTRLADIRRRKLSFTLLIDRPDVYRDAAWAQALPCTPFAIDHRLAQDVFLVQPHALDEEINLLLRLVRAPGSTPATLAATSPPPPTPHPAPTMPTGPNITVSISGGNANVTLGNESPITSHVQQAQGLTSMHEFHAALGALKEEIARLQSTKAREKLAAEAAVIEDAVATKPTDGKSRITKALEAIKHVGDAADGAEAVVDKVTKLTALAAPILAALF